jgi:hypothetical protein
MYVGEEWKVARKGRWRGGRALFLIHFFDPRRDRMILTPYASVPFSSVLPILNIPA